MSSDSTAANQKALQEIEAVLDANRPKHLGEGIKSGLGYIVGGALGACGIAVLSPVEGARQGKQKGGVVGGLVGGIGGAIKGVVDAANVAGGGVVQGVNQVFKGAQGTTAAVTEPRKGKWWNPNEGQWVLTNLEYDRIWLETQPIHDEDFMGDLAVPETEKKDVRDTYYYDLLELRPSATLNQIKRRYAIMARKFSPGRCGADNDDAKVKFQEIGNAYVILTNPVLREKYDQGGRAALQMMEGESEANPVMLYSLLFGSEKFEPYIGRLAAATASAVNDKVTEAEARLIQKRRVTRLALLLAERLDPWTKPDVSNNICKADWMAEAESLTKTSYGTPLVHTIGKVYSLASCQFLGSLESGIGLPSISMWAKKQQASLKHETAKTQHQVKNFAGNMDETEIKDSVKRNFEPGMTETEVMEAKEKLRYEIDTAMRLLWTQTVIDITNTLLETCNMVLFDQNVEADVRKSRAEALEEMGRIFESTKAPAGFTNEMVGQPDHEEAAFYAMLDTVRRQEISRQD